MHAGVKALVSDTDALHNQCRQPEWDRLRREVGGGRTRVAVDRFALAHA